MIIHKFIYHSGLVRYRFQGTEYSNQGLIKLNSDTRDSTLQQVSRDIDRHVSKLCRLVSNQYVEGEIAPSFGSGRTRLEIAGRDGGIC